MLRYIARKLTWALPLLWGEITLVFLLVHIAPGDAADLFVNADMLPGVQDAIRARWGLDDPLIEQYGRMLGNLATGDLGWSIALERPVGRVIAEALPHTLLLSATTLLVIITVGMALGLTQAVRRHHAADHALGTISLFFYSMPGFWLALMLVLLFSLELGWLPSSGMVDPVRYERLGLDPPICWGTLCVETSPAQVWDRIRHLLLPAVALGVAQSAGLARHVRSSLSAALSEDYVLAARARGLSERAVVGHALRNALLPVITLTGLSLPYLLSGSVIIETVFAWPGMGRLMVQAIFNQDAPVIIATVFLFTVVVVVGNLLADIGCAIADPRIQLR